jgi:hypothetical protein
MKKGFKKEHADVINAVAESASKAANAFNKLGKEINKAKHHKQVVSASEMIGTTLYSLSDGLLYRRLKSDGPIEKLFAGRWEEVTLNYNFLTNEKFREY